ncbi:MAG: hypothetical protein AAGI08_10845 [Bacteroidota bacterium]
MSQDLEFWQVSVDVGEFLDQIEDAKSKSAAPKATRPEGAPPENPTETSSSADSVAPETSEPAEHGRLELPTDAPPPVRDRRTRRTRRRPDPQQGPPKPEPIPVTTRVGVEPEADKPPVPKRRHAPWEPPPPRTRSAVPKRQRPQNSPVALAILAASLLGACGALLWGVSAFSTPEAAPLPAVPQPRVPTDPALFEPLPRDGFSEPAAHEPVVYRDNFDRVYLQETTPVFLSLSTSGGAVDYVLQQDSLPGQTSPIFFRGSGRQEIRYNDQSYVVFSDGVPPLTRIEPAGTASTERDGMRYFGAGLMLSLVASDSVSGTAGTYLSIDGLPFERYAETIPLPREKRYTVRHYGVDNVGNAGAPHLDEFIVDLTPPTSQHGFMVPFVGNIVSPASGLELVSADQHAGVQSLHVRFDADAEFQPYAGVLPLDLEEGEHTVEFYATDAVGNVETPKQAMFYLDRTPPEVSVGLEGDQHQGEDGFLYVSPRTRVSIQATDNRVGLARIDYTVNDGPMEQYDAPFSLGEEPGRRELEVTAVDRVMNEQILPAGAVMVDVEPPVASHAFEGPVSTLRDTLYISSQTQIVLSAEDEASGVQGFLYALDGRSFADYAGSLTFERGAYHELTYFATDFVNNRAEPTLLRFYVDVAPPEIFSHFSVVPYAHRMEAGELLPVYPAGAALYLGATDTGAGATEIVYSVNGSPDRPHTSTVRGMDRPGLYEIRIRAEDAVGNRSEQTKRFLIGD